MRVVLYGATGMVGSRIATELQQRNHDVVGASRATGEDICQSESVAATVAGADAVVCAVSARGVDYTLTDVARSLTTGLRLAEVERLVIVGGAGGLQVSPGVRLVDSPGFPDEYKPEALQQADALEFYRGIADLDWTYVSPAAAIQPGRRTGQYRIGHDELLVDDNGSSEISAEDYACALADLLEQGGHRRQRIGVAW